MFQLVTLDDKFLNDIGLTDLSAEEKKQALDNIRVTLESRVGVKITQGLSDDQVDQFSNIISSDNQNEAIIWMNKNIPNYQDIVMQELDAIIDQIKKNSLSFIAKL
jgi:histidinol dehydrogenase